MTVPQQQSADTTSVSLQAGGANDPSAPASGPRSLRGEPPPPVRLVALAPARRMLWAWGGVTAVALMAPLGTPFPQLWPIALAILGALAAADAWLGRHPRALPTATATGFGRFQIGHAGAYPVALSGIPPGGAQIGLALPAGFRAEPDLAEVPAGDEGRSTVVFQLTASQRGRFPAPELRTSAASPLGLWEVRFAQPLAGELRAYPSLRREGRTAAALFLPGRTLGTRVQRPVGQGREFDRLREYQPGDAFADIHWRATAKLHYPVTRLYQIERTQEIHVVVDASRLSARPVRHGDHGETALERTLAAVLLLLAAAERQGDRFGLSIFDDRIRHHVPSGRGQPHYAACREMIATVPAGSHTPDMAEVVRDLRTRLRRRALVLLLTDVTDPVLAEDLLRTVPTLARRHHVLLAQLRPLGVQPLFRAPGARNLDEVYARLAGHLRHREFDALATRLAAAGVRTHLLEDPSMATQLIEAYLDVKRRQLL